MVNTVIEIADHICNVNGLSFGTEFDIEVLPIPESWEYLQGYVRELNNKNYKDFLEEMSSQIESISEMVKLIQA